MEHSVNWIVTADSRRALLFACQRTPGGEVHLEQRESIENTHESEHEHGRPVLAGGAERRGSVTRSGARAAPHGVAPGHELEEGQRRFAHEVRSWLTEARRNAGAERVVVFAPARFLGLLRGEFAGDPTTGLREGELTHLRPHELAAHPAVLGAVGAK